MHGSCLALLLLTGLAPSADPPAQVEKPLSELGHFLTKQGYTAVPLAWDRNDGMFLVRVQLDGHAFSLFLDTGASDAFSLTKAAGKVLGIASDTHEFKNEPWSDNIPGKKYGSGTVREVSIIGTDYRVKGVYSAIGIDNLNYSDAQVFNPKTGKDEPVQADGLIGQGFLLEHSAVIDHDTATLYLIPLARKDGPRLLGRWECVGGERDGKPVDKASERWVEFGKDETATLHLDGNTASGNCRMYARGPCRHVTVGVRMKGDTQYIAYGAYRVEGDWLKLCLRDEPVEPKAVKWEGVTLPTKFEAKKDSGNVYYEFKRVKAEKK